MQIAELERLIGLRIAKRLHAANDLILAGRRLIRTAHGIGGGLIDGVRDMLLKLRDYLRTLCFLDLLLPIELGDHRIDARIPLGLIAALAAHGIGTAYAIEKRCWVCIERARDSLPRVRRKPTRAVTIIVSGDHDTRM